MWNKEHKLCDTKENKFLVINLPKVLGFFSLKNLKIFPLLSANSYTTYAPYPYAKKGDATSAKMRKF